MDIFVAKKEGKQAMILHNTFYWPLPLENVPICSGYILRDKGFQWLIFSCITAACAAVILVKTALLGSVLSYSPAAATRRSKIFF